MKLKKKKGSFRQEILSHKTESPQSTYIQYNTQLGLGVALNCSLTCHPEIENVGSNQSNWGIDL